MATPKDANANWWAFSILPGNDSMPEPVNEPADGKYKLTYSEYLQLDKLLTAQRPASTAPDERAFIIAHQLFELAFKLMIFDLVVVATTISDVMVLRDDDFLAACTAIDHPLWIPARAAASRVAYASNLVGRFFKMIEGEGFHAPGPGEDFNFRADEFHRRFREKLAPASGFQSWQFRTVQLAFGKKPILSLPYFDASMQFQHYGDLADQHQGVEVIHPIIFGGSSPFLEPNPTSELADLDIQIYLLLERLGSLWRLKPVRVPTPDHSAILRDIDTAFYKMIQAHFEGREPERDTRVREFGEAVRTLCRDEWGDGDESRGRLRDFAMARSAWHHLKTTHPYGGPTKCIWLLDEADKRFGSFLPLHHNTVKKAKLEDDDPGSAGGGVRFLLLSQELIKLFPLFRALDMKGTQELAPAAW